MCSSADDPSMHERVTPRPPTVPRIDASMKRIAETRS